MIGKFALVGFVTLAACASHGAQIGADEGKDATRLRTIEAIRGGFAVTCSDGSVEAPLSVADVNSANYCPHVETAVRAPLLSGGLYRTVEGDPNFLVRCRWELSPVINASGDLLRAAAQVQVTPGGTDCTGSVVLACSGSGAATTCTGMNPVNGRMLQVLNVAENTFTRRETLADNSTLDFTWVNASAAAAPPRFLRDADLPLLAGDFAGPSTCNLSVQTFYRRDGQLSHIIAARDTATCSKAGDEVYACGAPDAQLNITCTSQQGSENRTIVISTKATFTRTGPDGTAHAYAHR